MIEKMLNNYERFQNELEADLDLLQRMLEQDMPDLSPGDTAALGKRLKQLKACADFVQNEEIDRRVEHAELRFRQLSYLDWMIKSRPQYEQEMIQTLWLEKLSVTQAAERLFISRSAVYRRKQKVLVGLDALIKENDWLLGLWDELE